MTASKIQDAVRLAKKADYVFVATADNIGVPHMTAAGEVELSDEQDCVVLSEWFCPGTVKNLHVNPAVSIVIWNKELDTGFQMLGCLRAVKNVGVLDGYLPGLEAQKPLPQVEKQLVIYIEKILDFKGSPHSDIDLKKHDFPLVT
jgi:hypothetical protein